MFKKITFMFIILIFLNFAVIGYQPIELSLDEKIGQMMCLDFRYWNDDKQTQNILQQPVTSINNEIKGIIAKYHIGGIILFSQNFVDKIQTKKLTRDLQNVAKDSGNLPLIIATDQEGGKVERFSFGRNKFKNNGEIKTAKEAFEKGKKIGKELKELGINCNFAPVVDVNSNPKNPVINVRSFGNDPTIVSEFGKNFLEGLHSENIIGTAKHFPGHGDTDMDSHFALPRVNKTLEQLNQIELKPFKSLTESGVDIVMSAHIELPKIETKMTISKKDGKKIFLPATLSRTILNDILRKQIGFNGVIITDAMNMKAISENFGEREAAKMAIQAGADILCMPIIVRNKDDIDKLDGLFKYLKEAISNKEISEENINNSITRIIKLKNKYCNNCIE